MSVTDGIGQTPYSFEHYLVTSTFLRFLNPKSRDFLRFSPCFVRLLELRQTFKSDNMSLKGIRISMGKA